MFEGNSSVHDIIKLDARTKMLATIIVAQIMICAGDVGYMEYLRWVVASIPFFIILLSGYFMSAVSYALIYLVANVLLYYVQFHSVLGSMIVVLLAGFISRLMPGIVMGSFLFRTTPVREFIASMEIMHMPNAVTIPIAIMFRFFPAIYEEYAFISRAMSMRKIDSLRNPLVMIEYRIVPLLMSILNIGNELSVAAVSRGLGVSTKRTQLCSPRLYFLDYIIMGILIGVFVIYIYIRGTQ